jgi:hypothetical protein
MTAKENLSQTTQLVSKRRIDWKLTFLLGLPFMLIILNSRVLFSAILRGWVDTWIYLGYFLDLPQYLHLFPKEYFGARLPWLLPGYLAHKLFSPVAATYILHVAFYSAAVISLYLVLKYTLEKRAALLTAFLMGCHFYFLESFGSDYIDGAGITYLLLTLAMVTNLARSQNSRLKLCLAGAFYGCLINTQLFLIAYTPLIILYYFYANPGYRRRFLNLIFVLLGCVGIILFLCSINYYLNGKFWFMRPLIKWSIRFSEQANPWWQPVSYWWKGAVWLVLPAITFLGSVVTLLFYKTAKTYPHRKAVLFFQLLYILTALIHVFWQTKLQLHVLNYFFYASYMLPAMFLALGSQLAAAVHSLSRQRFYLLFAAIVFISFLTYLPSVNQLTVQLPLISIAIVFGIAAVACLFYFKELAVTLTVLAMTALNLHGTRSWPMQHNAAFCKDAYLAVFKGIEAIKTMDPKNKSRFWLNERAPDIEIYQAVASTYLWAARLVSVEFPAVEGKNYRNYHPASNDKIFILSNEEGVVEKANETLSQIGFQAKYLGEVSIRQGPIEFKITHIMICNPEKELL